MLRTLDLIQAGSLYKYLKEDVKDTDFVELKNKQVKIIKKQKPLYMKKNFVIQNVPFYYTFKEGLLDFNRKRGAPTTRGDPEVHKMIAHAIRVYKNGNVLVEAEQKSNLGHVFMTGDAEKLLADIVKDILSKK